VDPLVILCVIGEPVDPGLVDREPFCRADFLPDCGFEFGQAVNGLHVLLHSASGDVGEYPNVTAIEAKDSGAAAAACATYVRYAAATTLDG
jgi:hypothetical protein